MGTRDILSLEADVKIATVQTDSIKPYWRNPRKNDVAVQAVAESIKRYGFRQPIVVDKNGVIIVGHTRWKAAKLLGLNEVPVHVADLDAKQAREYRIADNKTNELATWDMPALELEMEDLDIGWLEEKEEDEQANEDPGPQIDQANELQKKWGTKTGQLWLLGEHRLLCGDCTKKEDVDAVLQGDVPHLCVTDPPYGVEYDPAWRSRAAKAGHLAYADRRVGKVENDDRSDWREAWELFPGDVIYSWHPAGATSLVHAAALQDSGFAIRMQIIWAKSNFPIGRGDYHVRHEPCWYAVRAGKKSCRTKDRTQTTLWEISLDKNVDGGHSTQKPLECMARPIRNHESEMVYEPFLGSGTTLVACEQLKRKCRAIEISQAYVAVALQRWADMTGKIPILDGG